MRVRQAGKAPPAATRPLRYLPICISMKYPSRYGGDRVGPRIGVLPVGRPAGGPSPPSSISGLASPPATGTGGQASRNVAGLPLSVRLSADRHGPGLEALILRWRVPLRRPELMAVTLVRSLCGLGGQRMRGCHCVAPRPWRSASIRSPSLIEYVPDAARGRAGWDGLTLLGLRHTGRDTSSPST